MIYDDYLKRIQNYSEYKQLSKIYRIINRSIDFKRIGDIKNLYLREDILGEFLLVGKKFKRKSIGYSFCHSFRINLNEFLKMDNKDKKIVLKWKKVLLSYMNIEIMTADTELYNLMHKDGIEEFIKENNNNVLLAVSTVDMESRIKANEEILEIMKINSINKKYILFPSFGVSYDLFNTLVKKLKCKYVHIAGHGCVSHLKFVGSNVSPKTFENIFINENIYLDYLLLNCCYSYEFSKNFTQRFYNFKIDHTDILNDSAAFNFSASFYSNLMVNGLCIYDSYDNSSRDKGYVISK